MKRKKEAKSICFSIPICVHIYISIRMYIYVTNKPQFLLFIVSAYCQYYHHPHTATAQYINTLARERASEREREKEVVEEKKTSVYCIFREFVVVVVIIIICNVGIKEPRIAFLFEVLYMCWTQSFASMQQDNIFLLFYPLITIQLSLRKKYFTLT